MQTVTPLNEECGMLEWVPNTTGNILLKIYKERGIYTSGVQLKSMQLAADAKLEWVGNRGVKYNNVDILEKFSVYWFLSSLLNKCVPSLNHIMSLKCVDWYLVLTQES